MSEAKRMSPAVIAGCLLLGGLALVGCRSDEQNRIMDLKQGTYLGKPDQELNNEQVDELRHRVRLQQG